MQLRTRRDLGTVWLVAGAVFAASIVIVRAFDRRAETQMLALWIGYAGLAALGAALLTSAYWVWRRSTAPVGARAGLWVLIAVALVLWLIALIFPFL